MVKICLSGIVKNEAAIIERCLNRAKFALDYVALTDTGSTDGTINLIEEWGKNNNIPTKVFKSTWKNFEHNRTEALNNSSTAFTDIDYLLLIDADMQLEDHDFIKDDLKGDCYLVNQYNSAIEYANVRLVANRMKWKYIGVTHEFITSVTDDHIQEECSTLKIHDVGDGGSKDDKFVRDEKLLLGALKTIDPKNSLVNRYNFYLAQTYFDIGKYSKAIRFYKERIKGGGFYSEKWYSQYRIGLALEKLDRWDEAEPTLLTAYQMMPSRCESLVALVEHYVLKGDKPQHQKASLFIPRLQEMRLEPNEDNLFNFIHYKQYYIDYLTSINAYYTGKLDLGRLSSERVLQSEFAPAYIKLNVTSNLKFYP